MLSRRAPAIRERDRAGRLLSWYASHGRDLPWRRRPSPYRVWVSEMMLQQTTVATAVPYYARFLKRFPTLGSLAAAREQDVLALWSGLGYYGRARNFARAARLVRDRHAGRLPADREALLALPGVGPYTAAAILGIGFNLPHAALDANVTRVALRLGGIEGDPSAVATRRRAEAIVLDLMPERRASDVIQALMDLGATVCTARAPRCGACPLASACRARRSGAVGRIPRPKRAAAPIGVELEALVVRRPRRSGPPECLLVRRGEGRLMGGMWEFPLVPAGPGKAPLISLARRLGARVGPMLGSVRHTITRHRIKISVFQGWAARQTRGRRGGRRSADDSAAARLATAWDRSASGATAWCDLDGVASGPEPLALTGTARKIARLIRAGRA